MNLKAISEQVVVVTGASSGIGLVTARMFAKKGLCRYAGKDSDRSFGPGSAGYRQADAKVFVSNTAVKTRPSNGPDENGLHHPGYGLQEMGTHEGWIRGKSLYVKATKHRALLTFALAGVGLYILAKSGKARSIF